MNIILLLIENMNLSLVFENIENKLTSNILGINHRYENESKAIHTRYAEFDYKFHSDELNLYREFLLNEIKIKRDANLDDINNAKKTGLIDTIKNCLYNKKIAFKCSTLYDVNLALNKFKLNTQLDLIKLTKYSVFLLSSKNYNLNYINKKYKIGYFHILATNKIFVSLDMYPLIYRKLLIIDTNGSVLFQKKFMLMNDNFKISSKYIIRLYQSDKNEKKCIEIYDFQLNMVFKTEEKILKNPVFNNSGFAYKTQKTLFAFDIESFSSTIKSFQDSDKHQPFYLKHAFDVLIHFNKERLYFVELNGQNIYIINKLSGERVNQASLGRNRIKKRCDLKFDEKSNFYFTCFEDLSCNIYDSNGKFIYKASLVNTNIGFFLSVAYTSINTMVCSGRIVSNFKEHSIQYQEY